MIALCKDVNVEIVKAKTTKTKTRTVKIADVIHHRIRVLSVQRRMPMQDFIEGLLTHALRDKTYEKFLDEGGEKTTAAAA